MSFELLKELTETPGVPSREEHIRAIVERELASVMTEFRVDNLGNLITFRAGSGKQPRRIMFSAHMDEIGFIVRHIDDKGFIRLQGIGGHDPRSTVYQRVQILGKETLPGVIFWTTKPLHVQTDEDKKKTPTLQDCFVDTGLPAREVQKLVRIGDPVVIHRETIRLGDLVTGKAMDNRTAVYTLIMALKKNKSVRDDIFAVFTAQEEVGLRGAQVAGFGIAPDIGIALDTTLACDVPGTEPREAITTLGGGVGLTVMDGSMITDRALYEEFEALAEKKKIKYQPNLLPRGGTDAGAIQRAGAGARTITLSLPTRYIHTSIETIHWDDLQAKIELAAAYMKGK